MWNVIVRGCSAVFLAVLFGGIASLTLSHLFRIEIDAAPNHWWLIVDMGSNAISALAGLLGYTIGSRVFDGLTAFSGV